MPSIPYHSQSYIQIIIYTKEILNSKIAIAHRIYQYGHGILLLNLSVARGEVRFLQPSLASVGSSSSSSIHPHPAPSHSEPPQDQQHSTTIQHNQIYPPPTVAPFPITSSRRNTRMPRIAVTYESVLRCPPEVQHLSHFRWLGRLSPSPGNAHNSCTMRVEISRGIDQAERQACMYVCLCAWNALVFINGFHGHILHSHGHGISRPRSSILECGIIQ